MSYILASLSPRKFSVIIVLDLSRPGELWSTQEILINEVCYAFLSPHNEVLQIPAVCCRKLQRSPEVAPD